MSRTERIPRWLYATGITLVVLSWLPLALIARARVVPSREPRIHPIQDMDNQPRYKAQDPSTLFADGRAMRLDPKGTVAGGELGDDQALVEGKEGGAWVRAFPVLLTEDLMRRGQERYAIYCAACHGLSGYGDGPVAKRAESLEEGTWVPPTSYHTDAVRNQPVGQIFGTVSRGVRNMPAYASQIPARDRWAIVAYVRALQKSQDARIDDVPAELRQSLR
jgi:mono/diheme cytochrome c family protein